MWSDYKSEKQVELIKYMAAQIGFNEDDFLEIYLDNLYQIASNARHLGAISVEDFNKKAEAHLQSQEEPNTSNHTLPFHLNIKNYTQDADSNFLIPKSYNITDYLIREVRDKKNSLLQRKVLNVDFISATDLANFTYCPASYAIAKTFVTDTNENAVVGTSLHEQGRLLPRSLESKDEDAERRRSSVRNAKNSHFFSTVKSSTLLFSGHNGEKKYFRSSKGRFIGQPDYIFRNQDGTVFIVEEKFKYINNNDAYQIDLGEELLVNFSDNHKVQLASYIYGLDEFKAQEGYLVYWLYTVYNHQYGESGVSIKQCLVHRITRSAAAQSAIRHIYASILNFRDQQSIIFDPSLLKANKCARCVVNRFCGHKTGRFDYLTLPYHSDFLRLVKVPYPEKLKKPPIDLQPEKQEDTL